MQIRLSGWGNLFDYRTTILKNLPRMNSEPSDTLRQQSLTIDQFREMDNRAIDEYSIPIELMMETTGLQLALFISHHASRESRILIGIGMGNNGGGGLVASRRLAGWGYNVYLNIPVSKLKTAPASQLIRALAFGAKSETVNNPDIFVDAYFGFSRTASSSVNLSSGSAKSRKGKFIEYFP